MGSDDAYAFQTGEANVEPILTNQQTDRISCQNKIYIQFTKQNQNIINVEVTVYFC